MDIDAHNDDVWWLCRFCIRRHKNSKAYLADKKQLLRVQKATTPECHHSRKIQRQGSAIHHCNQRVGVCRALCHHHHHRYIHIPTVGNQHKRGRRCIRDKHRQCRSRTWKLRSFGKLFIISRLGKMGHVVSHAHRPLGNLHRSIRPFSILLEKIGISNSRDTHFPVHPSQKEQSHITIPLEIMTWLFFFCAAHQLSANANRHPPMQVSTTGGTNLIHLAESPSPGRQTEPPACQVRRWRQHQPYIENHNPEEG